MEFSRLFIAAALAAAFGSQARTSPPTGADPPALQQATAAVAQSDGEVRKVDKEHGKLTLRHGPLQNLDMPAMTMVFKAADPKLLDGLQVGDKIKFTAEKVDGIFTVTAIQPAP